MSLTITPSPFGSLTVSVAETNSTLSVTTVATSPSVLSMALGVPGPQGDVGPAGQGVAAGGTTGQALVKLSGTNYDTGWATITSGGGTWGSITGTLSNQTDLYNALNGKLSLSGGTMYGNVTFDGSDIYLIDADAGSQITLHPFDGGYISVDGGGNTTTIDPGTVTVEGLGGGAFSILDAVGLVVNDGISYTSFTTNGIQFANGTLQDTAFPPAGGTTSQYIDGIGALVTFPTYIKTAGQMVTSFRNNTGATLAKGTVVYINGQVGNKPTVAKAQANSEATSKATYGFVETAVANNTDGNIVILGLLENIDTQGYSDGDLLYLSPTTAGAWTKTQPFSPYHYVRVGTVIRGGHPTQGSIAVQVTNGFQLDEMSDVGATAPSNANVLTWDSTASQWLDKSISTILGYTPLSSTTASATYQTISGMSAYLSTASAVANYQSISGMSAYLSTASASANYIGTSAYATTAQAEAMTSTSTVVSPARFRDAYFTANVTKPNTSTWLTATSGTGGLNDSGTWDYRRLEGPTSAANTYVRADHGTNFGKGRLNTGNIDWSKYNALYFRIVQYAGADANSIFRAVLGEAQGINTGDPTVRSVGIRFNGTGAIKILAHNGTTLTTYTTSYSLTTSSATDILIISDGSGTVEVFANGTSIGSTTGGPTTLLAGTASQNCINYRIENNSTPSGTQVKTVIAGTTAYLT